MRHHLRFVTRQQVLLHVDGRNGLRPVWMSDISKGGLFVESQERPALRSTVAVTIETPDGSLDLRGEVVHHVTGAGGGVGIQFLNLTSERRAAIEAYVEGLAANLQASGSNHDLSSTETTHVHDTLMAFVKGFEDEAVYEALDLHPTATREDLDARLRILKTCFETRPSQLPAALAARLHHARQLLTRVTMLMKDEDRRLDYDFRHGHIFAEARIVAARSGNGIKRLQDTWNRAYPERQQRAHKATAEAIRAVNKLEYETAVEAGELALQEDPFNLELRDALMEWRNRLNRRKGPMPGQPRKANRQSS